MATVNPTSTHDEDFASFEATEALAVVESAKAPLMVADPYAAIQWSLQQTDVIEWSRTGTGHAVVIARAGCGKTFTLVYAASQAPETKIFQCSYGAEISAELKSKILTGEASTLHSAGFRQLRWAFPGKVEVSNRVEYRRIENSIQAFMDWVEGDKYSKGFENNSIYWSTHKDQYSLIANLVSWVKNTSPYANTLPQVLAVVRESAKSQDCSISWDYQGMEKAGGAQDQCEIIISMLVLKSLKLALKAFLNGNKSSTLEISYDDMLWLPLVGIRQEGQAPGIVQPLYELIYADEVQDFNTCMLELLQALLLPGGRMCLIGDPMQSLYAFRGADPNAIPRMVAKLDAQILSLTVTRRCPALVVQMAQAIVPDFTAAPAAPEGIVEMATLSGMYCGVDGGDFILSRTNAALVEVCMNLLKMGKKAYIVGKDIGKKIIASIKKIEGKRTFTSMEDMLSRIEAWRAKEIERISKQKILAKDINNQTDDVNDLIETILIFTDGANYPAEVYQEISALFADPDTKKDQFIACSTCHRAKGLERDRVWILEYSFKRPIDDAENRIRYVAITRTKNELYLVTES